MKTLDAINKLPPKYVITLREFGRQVYQYRTMLEEGNTGAYYNLEQKKELLRGYLLGILDANVITESQFRALYIYFGSCYKGGEIK